MKRPHVHLLLQQLAGQVWVAGKLRELAGQTGVAQPPLQRRRCQLWVAQRRLRLSHRHHGEPCNTIMHAVCKEMASCVSCCHQQ